MVENDRVRNLFAELTACQKQTGSDAPSAVSLASGLHGFFGSSLQLFQVSFTNPSRFYFNSAGNDLKAQHAGKTILSGRHRPTRYFY